MTGDHGFADCTVAPYVLPLRIAPGSGIIYGGTMLRVVIDTDVLVSAFISSTGASRQLLLDALDEKFTLLLSTPLLVESIGIFRVPRTGDHILLLQRASPSRRVGEDGRGHLHSVSWDEQMVPSRL